MVNALIKTYNEHYLEARRCLKAADIPAAALEARILLSYAADKSEAEFLRDIRLYPADEFSEKAELLLQRRIAGEPLAYIIGHWSFYGLEFELSPDVLIPRSDTELLVDAALNALRDKRGLRILDLCTGSGCIGLAIAANAKTHRIVLADKSKPALLMAQKNAKRLGLRFQTLCVEADALLPPSPRLGSFDLICTNPPYIPSREVDTLDPSVKDYEPRPALDGGLDGLDFYRSILGLWTCALNPGGKLILECGEEQSAAIRRIAAEHGLLFCETIQDSLGTERILVFAKPICDKN